MNKYLELLEYVRTHSGYFDERDSPRHRSLVKKLLKQPELIGINDVVEAYPEVTLIDKDGYEKRRIDLIYFTKNDMYLVEIKTKGRSSKMKSGGAPQLHDYYAFFLKKYDISGRMIKVIQRGRGKLKPEEIKRPLEHLLKSFNYDKVRI